jgi:hypothetical protein
MSVVGAKLSFPKHVWTTGMDPLADRTSLRHAVVSSSGTRTDYLAGRTSARARRKDWRSLRKGA